MTMMRTALKGALARKARLGLTFVSIMLGVAFVVGTLVFTDTIQARFNSLFTDVYSGIDATVRAPEPDFGAGPTAEMATIDQALVDEVRAVDGVAVAGGYVQAFGQVIDANGDPVGGLGAPTYVYSWIDEPGLNPFRIADGDGRAPVGSGELLVDAATAQLASMALGDSVDVQFATGAQSFELVGIASFGDSNNLAGATISVVTLEDAQRILGLEGQVTLIDVAATEGVDQESLVAALAAALPSDVDVVSGSQQTDEAISGFTEGLSFLSVALLAFAAIAVFVGGFIIYNTFKIIVAQRTRELALMRALGASYRQVVLVVLAEAFVVGVLASLAGILAGIGVAQVIKAGMGAVGFGPPDGPLTLEPRSVIVGIVVGVVVTMASALVPAIHAARVLPVAAMQAPNEHSERPARMWLRATVLPLGVVAVIVGLVGAQVGLAAIGAIVMMLGVLMLAPALTRPITSLVGRAFPGVSGQLARENSARDPRRTSATAAALTVGIALVVFTAIFASSTKDSIAASMSDSFPGDLAVQSSNVYLPVSAEAIDVVRAVPEVAVTSALRTGPARVGGMDATVTAVEASTIDSVFNAGTDVTLAGLGEGLLVEASILEQRGLAVGQTATVQLPTGASQDIPIVGTHSSTVLGAYVVDVQTWSALGGGDDASTLLLSVEDGISADEGRLAVEDALASFPATIVTTTSDQIASAVTQVDALLALFTGLLGLALLIAVLGIANTLALSIAERTREIGLLRAVGMSRRQVRWMITDESIITALFGAAVGSVLGLVLGWVIVRAFSDQGLSSFAVPIAQLAVWILVSALAGVLAAALPARKAARLDVLKAIAFE